MSPRLSARRKGAVYEICPTCGHALRTGTPGKTALAQALFRKRVDGRLTLRAAAGAVGLSPASFYRAEKGEMPAVQSPHHPEPRGAGGIRTRNQAIMSRLL